MIQNFIIKADANKMIVSSGRTVTFPSGHMCSDADKRRFHDVLLRHLGSASQGVI